MTLSNFLALGALATVCLSSPLPGKPPGAGGDDADWVGSGPDVLSQASQKSSVARPTPQLLQAQAASGVPVGQIITSCTEPGTVAITFDDGPHIYTQGVLDILRDNNVKATFFVNGQNWGNINDEANKATVRRILDDGHHLGSHT